MSIKLKKHYNNIGLFNKFSKKYSPAIDLSIEKYLQNKKNNASYEFIADIYGHLNDYCLRKGKRIRPLVLLISCQGYKKNKTGLSEIIKLASILELMHSALLMQDDVIDKASLRRGKKTMHLLLQDQYKNLTSNHYIGNDITLVLVDVLFSNALEIISDSKIDLSIKNTFLKLFSQTYELTAMGQILDSMSSLATDLNINPFAASDISMLKTAYYTFYYPMLMGYVLAGGIDKKEIDKIKNFALPLGLAFQIRDDILGVFGDKDDIGKSSDSDLIEGKQTILVQNTLMNLNTKEKKSFIRIFLKKKKTLKEIYVLKNAIKTSGGLSIAERKMYELTSEARLNIDKLKLTKEAGFILTGIIDLMDNLNI